MRLKLSLNGDIFTQGVFSNYSRLFSLFLSTHEVYLSALSLNGCLCQNIDQRTHPNGALLFIFQYFSYPVLNHP